MSDTTAPDTASSLEAANLRAELEAMTRAANALADIIDEIDTASDRAKPAEGGKTSIAVYQQLIEKRLAAARRVVHCDGAGVRRWSETA